MDVSHGACAGTREIGGGAVDRDDCSNTEGLEFIECEVGIGLGAGDDRMAQAVQVVKGRRFNVVGLLRMVIALPSARGENDRADG
jgi:hypothetical protein